MGFKHSAETRAKIAATQTGKRYSAETRAKISASKTGKKTNRAVSPLGPRTTPEEKRAYQRAWRQTHKEIVAASQRRYREAHPDKAAEYDRRRRISRYGLTVNQFERLLESREGTCAICPVRHEEAPGRRLHIDHDHKTGVVRGLLCSLHNTALGGFNDDPVALRAAADYLERGAIEQVS